MHHLLVTHVNYKQTLYDIITNEGIWLGKSVTLVTMLGKLSIY